MKIPAAKAKMINLLIMAIFLTGGVALGWFYRKHLEAKPVTFVRQNPSDYKFIDPVLLLQVPEDTTTPQFQSLKKSISDYIATATAQKTVTSVSVYYRDLNNDRWVGVNPDTVYSPASMLKVVSLIAYLRAVQNDPSLYTKRIMITDSDVNKNVEQDIYPSTAPVKVGQTYSASDLLSYMIINSDNTAANALGAVIGQEAFDKTLTDLRLPALSQANGNVTFSPKMYSRLFRSLYNGAFLSDAISEQALELMSKTTFTQGLVAGVPSGTVVSHKFGERTSANNGVTIHQLHDCGIIYAPNDPYLLCIMTQGNDFTSLQKVISDISGITWRSVANFDMKK